MKLILVLKEKWLELIISGIIGYVLSYLPKVNLKDIDLENIMEINYWEGIPMGLLVMLLYGLYSYRLSVLESKVRRRMHILNYQSLLRYKSLCNSKPEEFNKYMEKEKEELKAVAYKMFEGVPAKEVDRIIDTIYPDENNKLWLCKKL